MESSSLGALTAALESGSLPLDETVMFLMTLDLEQITRNESSMLGDLLEFVASSAFPVRQGRHLEGCGLTDDVTQVAVSVELLAHVLSRLDPSGTVMTSHHVALARLAVESGIIEEALPVLDRAAIFYPAPQREYQEAALHDECTSPVEYLTIESGLTKRLSVTDVLQYELFRGMCYISQRKWRQAFAALERVITHPVKDSGCSKIMTDAHTKWVLVGLLADGKAPTVPITVSPPVQKVYVTVGKPYLAVASAFEEKTATALRMHIQNGAQAIWGTDGNEGLVDEVTQHYQRWQILHLRRVYSKVSLEQVRARTQSGETAKPLETVDEVEALVRTMIAEGMLDGHVESGETPYLVFHDQDEYSEAAFANEMAGATARITALSPLVATTNERLGTSREYAYHLMREHKREPDVVLNPMEDEDLMETS